MKKVTTDAVIKHLMSNGCELGTILKVVFFLTDNPQIEQEVLGLWQTNKNDVIHDIFGLLQNDEHFLPRVLNQSSLAN